jgi:ubiquinone/menaquinone biosynthesis C-methylase UbiE
MDKTIIRIGYRILNSRHFSKIFSSYRFTWEAAGITRNLALDAVLRGVYNEEEFWEKGRDDAKALRPFVSSNSICLDIGCGIGRVIKFLAPHVKEIHGVDVSSRFLKLAKNNLKAHSNIVFHTNNGHDFHFLHDDMFDFVYSLLVLQHIEKEDVYLYLEEIHRVLRKGGVTYLQIPNFLSDTVFGWYVKYAKQNTRHLARIRGYTEPEIERMMYGVGFSNMEISSRGDNIVVIATKTH